MARTRVVRRVWVLALCAGAVIGCGRGVSVAPAPFATTLQPDDRIESVSVTLAVGKDGAALDEPVALDLGLGYPLWLHPLGRELGEAVPFGAVAQSSTGGSTLQPGEQATFTFDVSGASGEDELLTTRYLLDATRVGDIRRIGLASTRSSDWVLGDFELRVNDEVLHADRAAAWAPDAEQKTSVARLAEIDRELAGLSAQYEALAAPDGADAAQVDVLESKATPLLEEKRQLTATLRGDARSAGVTVARDLDRLSKLDKDAAERLALEARLAGRSPWYVSSAFRPAWLPSSSAESATVTVETRAHAGADTLHPVYLRAGGHKYALNEPYEALSSAAGAQTFELDATTLVSTDLRGWALGMLGAPMPRESVPDRWHAQRVLVRVDGMVVYDSDDDARDRLSLDAVRLIPPAHRDASGAVVTNAASVREVFLWEAGRGAGLDSSGTAAVPLPAVSDPTYPRPESGLFSGGDSGTTPGSWPHASFPPLPGETAPWWGGGPSHAGGSGPSVQGGFNWGPQGGSVWGGLGFQGGGSLWGWALPWLPWIHGQSGDSGGGGNNGSGGGPKTTGKPFQMKDVWISSGWKLNEPFTVEWKVSGDTDGIRHFLVSLRVARPDQSQGLFKHVAKKPVKVAVGQRSCTVLVDPKFQPKHPYYYLAPVVTAVTKKGGKKNPQSHVRVGPARAVFPAIANTKIQPLPKDFTWKGGKPKPLSVGTAGQSMKHRTACFVPGAATPDAIQIGIAKPATHIALRPKHGDRITVRYEIPSFKGRQQLVGHVGFMGGTIAADTAAVEMACTLVGKAKSYDYPVWKGKVSTNDSLIFVAQMLDAADLGVAMTKAEVRVTYQSGGALDPKCVPGVYGLRCIPVKGTAPTKTVNADLVIDPTVTWLVPGDLRDGIYGGPPKQLCLAIRNNGPDPIPANLLREIKVAAKYYVGQCGTAWSKTYGREVTLAHVRVTDLRELSSNGPWKGALPKGGVLRLVPTPPKGHKDLAPDGRLASTLRSKPNESNAWKLFRVWADIKTTGAPELKESNPKNAWTHTYAPTFIIGKGPLDYEILLFEKGGFKGGSERYEYDPVTQRQRLVWHLGTMPGKRDMYQKVHSLMLGREIGVRGAAENHFYTCTEWGNWPLEATGGTKSAFQDRKVPGIGSLVLFPKSSGEPIGAMLECKLSVWKWKNTVDKKKLKRHVFIPLPEDPSVNESKLPTLIDELDEEIEYVTAWQTRALQGVYPVQWVRVTLFEKPGLGKQGGRRCTLASPRVPTDTSKTNWWARYVLSFQHWDGEVPIGKVPGIEEKARSVLLEHVAGAGK